MKKIVKKANLKGNVIFHVNIGQLSCEKGKEFIDNFKEKNSELLSNIKNTGYEVLVWPVRSEDNKFECNNKVEVIYL